MWRTIAWRLCVCVRPVQKKCCLLCCLCVFVCSRFFFFFGFLQSASTLRASIFFLWFGNTTVPLIYFLIGLFIIQTVSAAQSVFVLLKSVYKKASAPCLNGSVHLNYKKRNIYSYFPPVISNRAHSFGFNCLGYLSEISAFTSIQWG